MTKYKGRTITYDGIGNPTNYYNGAWWTMTWEHGRQLATITQTSTSTTWTNTYNSDGLRTSRTDGTTTYTYYYEEGRLSAIKRNDLNMWIIYDENGPVTLKYGVGTFHYVTNLQGDVVAIVGANGQKLVEYTYDAWGKVLSITGDYAYNLGIHNPILYRGYIYDHETGLYYCQSRYYDPQTRRFLNADAFTTTGQGLLGNNMFAYCGNNPIVRVDSSGESFAVIIGFNFNLFGWGMIGTINFVSTEDNLGVQYSYYFSGDAEISKKKNQTVGVDVGSYIGVQYTDKKSMDELEGYAKSTGGDLFLGGDILTDENGDYLGWQFGSSSFSANMHSLYTNTETLFSIPTLDLVEIIVDWIFGRE